MSTAATKTAAQPIKPIASADVPLPGQRFEAGIFVTRYWLGDLGYALVALPAGAEVKGVYGEYGQDVAGASSYSLGLVNTLAMAEAGSELAKQVLELGAHIPSALESQLLYAAKHAGLIDGFDERGWYLTSTQYSAGYAYISDFAGGGQLTNDKYYDRLVRPVRSLPIQ